MKKHKKKVALIAWLMGNVLFSMIANGQMNADLICKIKTKKILLDGKAIEIKKVKVLLDDRMYPEFSQIKYSVAGGKIESRVFSFIKNDSGQYTRISDLINTKKKYAIGTAASYSILDNKGTLSFALLKIEDDGTIEFVPGSAKDIKYEDCEYTHESREE
ncbi:MAG: hypothetical protein QE271_12270 [Bacteriovoracaceae bacterium]|nr:hypothetical protein [Bacteriovoracaceae bacterium]